MDRGEGGTPYCVTTAVLYHDGVIRLQYSAEEQQFQRNLAFIVKPKENERPTTVMSTCVTMLPTTLL
ncbi:hypothetical protein CYMTET_19961 [Cymbomonas tetramitiformis]|uniref:Uncharacterized protein n=1 Tax=Cymbomonas tetramitiformis TaxID=36881 RepID=A0AAE0G548_9CHLO|nr:hypothetical protein CYMTET_19961 [Cymbomonas tetramitiformis]